MRFLKQIAVNVLLGFLSAIAVMAGTNDLRWQLITLPSSAGASHFANLNNDGRLDLLAVDVVERELLIYRQRALGFTNAPDQVLHLPPQTAWIAPCDVDAHPGLELLLSTATGLVFYRQDGGLFESEPRSFIQASQVFTNGDSPRLVSLATNAVIPVITATQAVLYLRNNAFEWSPGQSIALDTKRNSLSGSHNEWTVGPNPSRNLFIQQSVRSKPDAGINIQEFRRGPQFQRADDQKPENNAIGKLIQDMKKIPGLWHQPGMSRVDLNRDGRMDLVIWQDVGDMEPRTDVYVFLRGADDKLLERPTQALHCRGFPIPVGSTYQVAPIGDLKGDGTYELLLLELKKGTFTSASGLVEVALSRGLDWSLTIRPFNRDGFARSPDAAVPLTALLASERLTQWPLFVCGDFNGDGRPDIMVQRSSTQWHVYFSTNDGRWFAPQSGITFETPMQGYFELYDLNGDRRADIILRAFDDPRIYILLTQPSSAKGKLP